MPIRASLVALALAAVAACTPVTPPAGEAPRGLGACCPETDAGIISLMSEYENTPQSARRPELAILPYRIYSGLSQRERLVVRDAESWAALWTRIVGSHRPAPPAPAVDFSKEMVVVASMGSRPTGGYTIYIDDLSVLRGTLVIPVREQSPGPRCGTTQAVTAPMALARLERSELPVRFVTRDAVRDC